MIFIDITEVLFYKNYINNANIYYGIALGKEYVHRMKNNGFWT